MSQHYTSGSQGDSGTKPQCKLGDRWLCPRRSHAHSPTPPGPRGGWGLRHRLPVPETTPTRHRQWVAHALGPHSSCVSQRTHDAMITSLSRQNDVVTSFWRYNDVIFTPCARWAVLTLTVQIQGIYGNNGYSWCLFILAMFICHVNAWAARIALGYSRPQLRCKITHIYYFCDKNNHNYHNSYDIYGWDCCVVVLHVPGWPGCSPCGGEPMHLRLVFLGVLLFLFPYFQLFWLFFLQLLLVFRSFHHWIVPHRGCLFCGGYLHMWPSFCQYTVINPKLLTHARNIFDL